MSSSLLETASVIIGACFDTVSYSRSSSKSAFSGLSKAATSPIREIKYSEHSGNMEIYSHTLFDKKFRESNVLIKEVTIVLKS